MDSFGSHGSSQNQNTFSIGNTDSKESVRTAEDARFEFTQRLVFDMESRVDKLKDQLISLKITMGFLFIVAIFIFGFFGYNNWQLVNNGKAEYDKLRYINNKLEVTVNKLDKYTENLLNQLE